MTEQQADIARGALIVIRQICDEPVSYSRSYLLDKIAKVCDYAIAKTDAHLPQVNEELQP